MAVSSDRGRTETLAWRPATIARVLAAAVLNRGAWLTVSAQEWAAARNET